MHVRLVSVRGASVEQLLWAVRFPGHACRRSVRRSGGKHKGGEVLRCWDRRSQSWTARRSPLYPQGKPFSRAYLGACERRPFVTAEDKNLGRGEQRGE